MINKKHFSPFEVGRGGVFAKLETKACGLRRRECRLKKVLTLRGEERRVCLMPARVLEALCRADADEHGLRLKAICAAEERL